MAKEKDVKIRPLDDRIVVEALEAADKTTGGILLPDTAKQKPQKGTIVAVGQGKLLESGKRQDMSVKVGDVVLFARYAGNDVEVNGRELKIMRESDLLAREEK